METLRKTIYWLKRLIQGKPALYSLCYSLITCNVDYLKQKLSGKQFPSKFGGLWTDSTNFEKQRQALAPNLDPQRLQHWHEKGYSVFENAISPELIDTLLDDIVSLPELHPEGLRVTGPGFDDAQLYTPTLIKPHESTRIVDFYFYNENARKVLFDETIINFLNSIFQRPAVLTQSLSFNYGSEQAIHQDTAFVIMNSPIKFVGVWVALEDVKQGSGELMYYPGSHRWQDYLFSERFKHFDEERDGLEQLEKWQQWLHQQATEHGTEVETFLPKKGDVLIWHPGLAHGGAPITMPDQTRFSLVGHFCAAGVRPLYHYYKPAQRKLYPYDNGHYSSAYYR